MVPVLVILTVNWQISQRNLDFLDSPGLQQSLESSLELAQERLARELGALLGRLALAECLLLAAVSGVAEEAFFRGALQPRVGLVAASLIFGLAHFAPKRELAPWTVFSIGAGFLLGALFDATGNLLAPVVAHVLINAVNLRMIATRYA